jgi:chromosome segregation ATPase
MHQGLKKLFVNLSLATKKAEERKERREKLQGYLRKIKIVAAQSPKRSVISSELKKLESHIAEMLHKKIKIDTSSKERQPELSKLKEKEQLLDSKIAKLNELLSKVGKKISEDKLKKQLEQELKSKSVIEEIEDKIYSLESKYYDLKKDPEHSEELLNRIQERISALKEKIREIRNRS